MKNVETNLIQESVKKVCQGMAAKLGVSLLGAAFILAPLGTAKADSPAVTQLQYLQTVAQLSGAAGQFVQVITAKKSTQTAPSSPTKATSGSPHKITICHKGHVTITVDDAALDAHLAHGDTIGACRTSE